MPALPFPVFSFPVWRTRLACLLLVAQIAPAWLNASTPSSGDSCDNTMPVTTLYRVEDAEALEKLLAPHLSKESVITSRDNQLLLTGNCKDHVLLESLLPQTHANLVAIAEIDFSPSPSALATTRKSLVSPIKVTLKPDSHFSFSWLKQPSGKDASLTLWIPGIAGIQNTYQDRHPEQDALFLTLSIQGMNDTSVNIRYDYQIREGNSVQKISGEQELVYEIPTPLIGHFRQTGKASTKGFLPAPRLTLKRFQ